MTNLQKRRFKYELRHNWGFYSQLTLVISLWILIGLLFINY